MDLKVNESSVRFLLNIIKDEPSNKMMIKLNDYIKFDPKIDKTCNDGHKFYKKRDFCLGLFKFECDSHIDIESLKDIKLIIV